MSAREGVMCWVDGGRCDAFEECLRWLGYPLSDEVGDNRFPISYCSVHRGLLGAWYNRLFGFGGWSC